MKFLSIFTIFLFVGCSYKDAFTYFNINNIEKSIYSNMQSGKIFADDNTTVGIIKVIHLNPIEKGIDQTQERFFISIYTKNKNKEMIFKLNNQLPLEQSIVSKENYYAAFFKENKAYNIYYKVSFQNNSEKVRFSFFNKNKKNTLIFNK